jgi:hypothetical protein
MEADGDWIDSQQSGIGQTRFYPSGGFKNIWFSGQTSPTLSETITHP